MKFIDIIIDIVCIGLLPFLSYSLLFIYAFGTFGYKIEWEEFKEFWKGE